MKFLPKSFRGVAVDLAGGARDVLFPPQCVRCGDVVEGGCFRHVCARCSARIFRVRRPCCGTCGHPFFGDVDSDAERSCPHCVELRPKFREGRTVVLFKGAARAMVHGLKYGNALFLLGDFERLIAENTEVLEWVRGRILIPVPLHPRKLRERGYNQAVLLAEIFARAAGGETRVAHLLRRDTDTVSQTFFDRKTRQENLKNAFAMAKGAVVNPRSHYLVVDDIFTTGSTLNSCAAVLRKAGAVNINVLSFGHG